MLLLAACKPPAALPPQSPLCDQNWYESVERRVGTGDGQGHGPDIGSGEWKRVVEFRLGVRDAAGFPEPESDAWCNAVEQRLRAR